VEKSLWLVVEKEGVEVEEEEDRNVVGRKGGCVEEKGRRRVVGFSQ